MRFKRKKIVVFDEAAEYLHDPKRVKAVKAAAKYVLPPDEVVDAICANVKNSLGVQFVVCDFVYDDKVEILGTAGYPEGYPTEARLSDSFCATVVVRKRPLLLDSAAAGFVLKGCTFPDADSITKYAGHPVRFQGEVIGVIAAVSQADAPAWDRATIVSNLERAVLKFEAEIAKRS